MDGNDLTTLNSVIRPAQATDANALAACIDAAYAQYAERIFDMPSVSDGFAEDIANNQVWVAVQNDEVIAGLILIADDGFMKLANLAVHPDHVGKGLGRKLIEHSEREAKRQGFSEPVLQFLYFGQVGNSFETRLVASWTKQCHRQR
jgi:N-acetylglutamate synthase-like GNAT family acetyltransferase